MKSGIDKPDSVSVLGTHVHATSYEKATETVLRMAREGQPGYVCAANVHMVMEAYDSSSFRACVNGAELVTPDGVPLVWFMKKRGFPARMRQARNGNSWGSGTGGTTRFMAATRGRLSRGRRTRTGNPRGGWTP